MAFFPLHNSAILTFFPLILVTQTSKKFFPSGLGFGSWRDLLPKNTLKGFGKPPFLFSSDAASSVYALNFENGSPDVK